MAFLKYSPVLKISHIMIPKETPSEVVLSIRRIMTHSNSLGGMTHCCHKSVSVCWNSQLLVIRRGHKTLRPLPALAIPGCLSFRFQEIHNQYSAPATGVLEHGLKFHTTAVSDSSITKFINSQDDLDRFLAQIQELYMTDLPRKYWNPQSRGNLQQICQHLLERNCECMNIYSFFKKNPSILATNQDSLHYTLDYLRDLGFRGNQLLYILDQQPDIWRLRAERLQERVQQLWNLGLGDGQLKKAILNYPPILSIKRRRFQSIVDLLRKLQFTSQHIPEVIADSPQVFDEEEYQTELKFQYVLFMMGITDYREILKAKIFNYSHEHIRLRHLVLERLGLYQVPDKHGRTKIRNSALCRIVDSTDKRFASACAGISLEELNLFYESLKEELAEAGEMVEEGGDSTSDSNSDGHNESSITEDWRT